MKILLTGKPRIGKTTIIKGFRSAYKGKMCGIVAEEVYDATGESWFQSGNPGKEIYTVQGNHGVHKVCLDEKRERHFICDCPLYLGAGEYAGKPGECSHIQAVRLNMV